MGGVLGTLKIQNFEVLTGSIFSINFLFKKRSSEPFFLLGCDGIDFAFENGGGIAFYVVKLRFDKWGVLRRKVKVC